MQNEAMDRAQVISVLQARERELRAAGVVSVSLFGSTARGESAPHDVDLAVRLAENFSRGGFDYFGRLEDLERHLSELLGCKVDVVEEPVRRARFQQEINRDRTLAF
jgi:predicted nucleotidyltransferase